VDFKSKSLPQNPKTTRTQFTILQKKKKKKLQNPTKPVKQKKKHRIIDRIQVINTKLNTQLWNQSNFTFPPNSSPWPIKNQTPNHQIHANPFPLTNKEARTHHPGPRLDRFLGSLRIDVQQPYMKRAYYTHMEFSI
jgi:hypothetical protein